MVLSEVILKVNAKESKASGRINREVVSYKGDYYVRRWKSSIVTDNFLDEEAEGITQKQIDKIKKLGFNKIRVSQTIPFAPFIFLGVILTLLAKGNILIVVKNLLL